MRCLACISCHQLSIITPTPTLGDAKDPNNAVSDQSPSNLLQVEGLNGTGIRRI